MVSQVYFDSSTELKYWEQTSLLYIDSIPFWRLLFLLWSSSVFEGIPIPVKLEEQNMEWEQYFGRHVCPVFHHYRDHQREQVTKHQIKYQNYLLSSLSCVLKHCHPDHYCQNSKDCNGTNIYQEFFKFKHFKILSMSMCEAQLTDNWMVKLNGTANIFA